MREKTLDEMILEAESKRGIDKNVFAPFLEQYGKLVMINPTKRKFRESVIDHHFYELMRQYSNNLEKENTLLMVLGFSFADEHIADITRRAANTNPTLHIVVFAYDDNAGESIQSNLKISEASSNNNIDIVTPASFKALNSESADSKIRDLVSGVTCFDFKAVNDLFRLISNGIVVYGK